MTPIIPIDVFLGQAIPKEAILAPLLKFFTEENYSHAEGKSSMVKDDFLNKYFYFRNFLADLFKKDIFIVRGYKGTGKTLIYNALQNEFFVKEMIRFYNINGNYRFLNVVTYNRYPKLAADNYVPARLELSEAVYYKRFWVVYVWNEILSRSLIAYSSPIATIAITNEEITRQYLEKLMQQDTFIQIEQDLRAIDKQLKTLNDKLVISFDYLDDIVDLPQWYQKKNALKELMNWCRSAPYQQIYPKMFIRTDLYHKIDGIVNKSALESKVLSLDWSTDELFAYFFKIVYAKCFVEFIQWLLLNNQTEKKDYILNIQKLLANNKGQITIENKDVLTFLVNNFFGEYINPSYPNYGQTYTWFYENLKSTNDFISLRPFISLLEKALKDAQSEPHFMKSTEKPLLNGDYFASNAAREYAAGEHFKDILKEEKDGLLEKFEATIRGNNPALRPYRFMSLDEYNIRALIIKIYELNGDSAERREKWRPMLERLEEAGVIRQNLTFHTTYSFAFLYKFYFRLRGNPAKR